MIKKAANGARVAEIDLHSGGHAYVRRPTRQEFEAFQAYADADRDARGRAHVLYVKGCFLGAIDGSGLEISFEEAWEREGPAWVSGGAIGVKVNELAGIGEARSRFL